MRSFMENFVGGKIMEGIVNLDKKASERPLGGAFSLKITCKKIFTTGVAALTLLMGTPKVAWGVNPEYTDDSGIIWSYTVNEDNESVTITGATMEENDMLKNIDLVIPEKIGGKTVTKIGTSAFVGRNMASVRMTTVKEIDDQAFHDCRYMNWADLGAVEVIGNHGFNLCFNLEEVTFEHVVNIGANAFGGSKLKKLHIPKSAKVLDNPFRNCYYLEEITLDPDNTNFGLIDGVLYAYIEDPSGKKLGSIVGWPYAVRGDSWVVDNGVYNGSFNSYVYYNFINESLQRIFDVRLELWKRNMPDAGASFLYRDLGKKEDGKVHVKILDAVGYLDSGASLDSNIMGEGYVIDEIDEKLHIRLNQWTEATKEADSEYIGGTYQYFPDTKVGKFTVGPYYADGSSPTKYPGGVYIGDYAESHEAETNLNGQKLKIIAEDALGVMENWTFDVSSAEGAGYDAQALFNQYSVTLKGTNMVGFYDRWLHNKRFNEFIMNYDSFDKKIKEMKKILENYGNIDLQDNWGLYVEAKKKEAGWKAIDKLFSDVDSFVHIKEDYLPKKERYFSDDDIFVDKYSIISHYMNLCGLPAIFQQRYGVHRQLSLYRAVPCEGDLGDRCVRVLLEVPGSWDDCDLQVTLATSHGDLTYTTADEYRVFDADGKFARVASGANEDLGAGETIRRFAAIFTDQLGNFSVVGTPKATDREMLRMSATVNVAGQSLNCILQDPNGALPEGTQLRIDVVEPGSARWNELIGQLDSTHPVENLAFFEITLYDANGEPLNMPLDAKVRVLLQIPEGWDKADLEAALVRSGADAEFDEDLATIDGVDYLSFWTDHFSPYVMIDKLTPAERAALKTGEAITLYAALDAILLAAAGALVLILTKKRKLSATR